jgi:endonuclease YncB( thermonuclease family)
MKQLLTRIAVTCSAAAVALGVAAVPANAVVDRDCGDFASQRAAQVFYLRAGGPRSDPHRLDSDGDHVVCESNPAPYYYGTTVPGQSQGPGQPSSGAATMRVRYVVDGDTIRLANGRYVRLIGIDTPEVGRPYYGAAKRNLDHLVGARIRLVNPASVDDRDHYGRLLRYVHSNGRDTGLAQLRKGYAHARYDGRDGYDWHPRQAQYRSTDAHTRDLWRVG